MQLPQLCGLRPPRLQHPREVSQWFANRGISVRAWCAANSLSHNVVSGLLRGVLRGNRGKSFQAAVILGLKDAPTDDDISGETTHES